MEDQKKLENEFSKYLVESNEFDIRDLWQGILRRKRIVYISTLSIFIGSLLFTLYAKIFSPVYRGSFSILTNDPMLDSNTNKSNRADANQNSLQYTQFEDIALSKSTYNSDTLIELLKSPIYLDVAEKDLNLKKGYISKIISIKPPKSNLKQKNVLEGVLNVEINLKNKFRGQLILEKLSDIYLKSSLKRKQQRLNDGIKFLEKQAPSFEDRKKALQSKLVDFREKNKLIEPSQEGKTIKSQLKLIDKKIIDLNLERDRLLNLRNQVGNDKLTAIGFKEKLGDGFLVRDSDQDILQELIALEKELIKAKTKYTLNSMVIKNLLSRYKKVQKELKAKQIEAIDTAMALSLGKLNAAKTQKKEIEKEFIKQPRLIKEYKNIEQELDFINQNILGLEKARESFQLELAQNTIPWRVISKPEMLSKPIRPNVRQNLLTGSLFGIIVGIILALLRDKIDNVYHSPNEIKKSLDINYLATIPYLKDVKKLILEEKNKDPKVNNEFKDFIYKEAFRYLYSSIKFLDIENTEKRIIGITSSIPSEGKTLVSILLSKTISNMNKKVLLIDADMRRPSVHKDLGIKNDYGLTDILLTDINQYESNIKQVDRYNNFFLLTAGSITTEAPKLLASKNFKSLISNISQSKKYDFIILNNTPLLGLSDALYASENTDGVILVVSLNKVNKELVKESLLRIKSSKNISIIGLVANYIKRYEFKYYVNDEFNIYDKFYKSYYQGEIQKSKPNSNNNLIKKMKSNKFIYEKLVTIKKFIRWLDK